MLDGETSVLPCIAQASPLPNWPQGSRSIALATAAAWAPPDQRMYSIHDVAITVICTQFPSGVARHGTGSKPPGSVNASGLFNA